MTSAPVTRVSCGYLFGILLHKEHSEDLCPACALASERYRPVPVSAAEAERHRRILADAAARRAPSRPRMGLGASFPVL